MNWCSSKKLKNVSESVILASLECEAKKLRNCDLFFKSKIAERNSYLCDALSKLILSAYSQWTM
jgi:hypothetical protein